MTGARLIGDAQTVSGIILLMETIATMGAVVRVTPGDELQVLTEHSDEFVDDPTPFEFRVEGRLEDGQIFYGPVVSGPERYHDLICNIIIRAVGSDWRTTARCQANFKVGPSKAERRHDQDFRHPEGTAIPGYPLISRFG